MKFRKIISIIFSILTISVLLGKIDNLGYATLTSEEYYSCFENLDLSEIIINKLIKEDEEALKNMIDKDPDFSKYLGDGNDNFNSGEYLKELESISKLILAIRNTKGEILGFVYLNKCSDEHQLEVGYWIGKPFRKKGYVNLAVSKIISKIWEIDKLVSFVFDIDDENIASIKTLEKICSNLKIDLNSSRFMKKHLMTVEIIIKQNEDGTYLFQSYIDDVLNVDRTFSKEQLLKSYSEDKLKNGIHQKQSFSTYLLKNLESTV